MNTFSQNAIPLLMVSPKSKDGKRLNASMTQVSNRAFVSAPFFVSLSGRWPHTQKTTSINLGSRLSRPV
jgi:hypothetical protein